MLGYQGVPARPAWKSLSPNTLCPAHPVPFLWLSVTAVHLIAFFLIAELTGLSWRWWVCFLLSQSAHTPMDFYKEIRDIREKKQKEQKALNFFFYE